MWQIQESLKEYGARTRESLALDDFVGYHRKTEGIDRSNSGGQAPIEPSAKTGLQIRLVCLTSRLSTSTKD